MYFHMKVIFKLLLPIETSAFATCRKHKTNQGTYKIAQSLCANSKHH